MLLDANILLYATDESSHQFERARAVLTDVMNGSERVALPWQTIGAFVRVATNPRVYEHPMTGVEAWGWVEGWLARRVTWIPPATATTALEYRRLVEEVEITSNLVPDAMLAALAIEQGVELWSADSDFDRFPRLRWRNPLRADR